MQPVFESLCRHFRELAMLDGVNALLGWDERTRLPPQAGPYRAEQMSFVAGLLHQRRTDPRVGEWLDQLTTDPNLDRHSDVGATIHELQRDYEKQVKIPQRLVEALTHASVVGQQVWAASRKQNSFRKFAPNLTEIIKLSREKADAVEIGSCRYDALLDDYEPGAQTQEVAAVLRELGAQLAPLVQEIADSGRVSPRQNLFGHYPVDAQRQFGQATAAQIGFDFDAGRLDETDHPFCTTLGPRDCRILTRYNPDFFPSAFFGTLHEAGHGIYEQGLRPEYYGLPPGQPASLGIHESQSRLWENFVGRSESFWTHFFPRAQRHFPGPLKEVPFPDFYWAINDVRPSLIRVEADEATYNLHIIIRFELEQELIDGQLAVADLPTAWGERYQSYLGITPPDDASGVLQDIHWSAGLFGYFATYSLGNLFAAQLFAQAGKALPDLTQRFAQGQFDELLAWLREHVHRQGRCYRGHELVARICQQPLSCQPLMGYLRQKLEPLYSLT